MSLNKKLTRFVEAYLVEPNGTKAAIAAGYSAKTAAQAGSRLLKHVDVAAELARRRKTIEVKSGVTAEMVVAELAKLGFADIRQVVEWRMRDAGEVFDTSGNPVDIFDTEVTIKNSDKISAEAAAAIAEVSQSKDGTLKVKMHDKLGALIRIGQHLGMFRASTPEDEPGKKKKAEEAAKSVGKGSSWGDDLSFPDARH